MNNKQRIKQLFIEVANKASEALASGTRKPQPGIVTTSLLIRSGLIFHADVADLFFKNVDEAAELTKENPAWSKFAVDRIFSEGLAAISDGVSVADAAQDFYSKLEQPPETYQLRFGIFGLSEGCEDTDFGKIRLRSTVVTPQDDFGPFLKKGVTTTYHYAEMAVEAVDIESAKSRGVNLLDRHLAVLNILCACGNPAHSYLSGRYISQYDFTIYQEKVGEDWSERISSSRIRVLVMPPEWKRIIDGHYKKRFSELFCVENPFSEHLLSALELAGSSLRESSAQNAFLLLAIALEGALMGGKSEQEIANQFALRAALLSKGTADQRVSLYKKIKRLYKLRSNIVHRGSKDITDKDLAEMRDVCFGCLLALCTSNDFLVVRTFEELDAWFLKRMLSAPEPTFQLKA